jgi:SAM-dependent methyltransferase
MSPGRHTARPAMLDFGPPLTRTRAAHTGEVRPESHLRLGQLGKNDHNEYSTQAPSLRLPASSALTNVDPEYRIRRSRIVSALQSHSPLTPSSPFSIGDYARGYEDHNVDSTDSARRSGNAVAAGQSDLLSPSLQGSYPSFPKRPETSHHKSAALLDIAERDREGPAGQSDLRFAALMTSRWLSFGRVLFSPAHDVVQANSSQRVLVIDGLGNDDWSFYCAVTYPRAVIYDLKETDVGPGSQPEAAKENWRAPSNYKRAELPNLGGRFPFPQSYFAAVVFRFPAAMSDTILKMAFSECKRVLVPGGYLELSLLDLDIVNMGTITRHAIRDLKARMIGADPGVSLKPASDNVQNILGQKGFENLNRCVLSVPVAGEVATSSGSRSSRSSRDSYNQKAQETEQGSSSGNVTRNLKSPDSDRDQQRGGNFSLNELVSDHSATGDKKISRMIAKVGRFWWTRSYEWAVLADGNLKKSIWYDKRMLHECKTRGSGFKLLIAYAQKPVETRRRTLSEPIRPTAAVSGTRMMNRYDEAYRTQKTR